MGCTTCKSARQWIFNKATRTFELFVNGKLWRPEADKQTENAKATDSDRTDGKATDE